MRLNLAKLLRDGANEALELDLLLATQNKCILLVITGFGKQLVPLSIAFFASTGNHTLQVLDLRELLLV